MRKIIVFTNLTLDGVMQAPGRRDEDPRGNFQYGGWGAPYAAMSSISSASLGDIGSLLFGRRTYEDFYAYWPNQKDNPYTDVLNQAEKYVASTTLQEPLPWQNSYLIRGSVPLTLTELKAQPGKDFLVFGSGVLVQTLMEYNLIDRYVLLIHPLVLGSGRRLFPHGSPYTTLELVGVEKTPSGVVAVTYRPAVK